MKEENANKLFLINSVGHNAIVIIELILIASSIIVIFFHILEF